MDKIIKDNSPVIYLHSKERYFPSTVDYYLKNVDVVIGNKVALSSPTQEELYNFSTTNPNANDARMVLNTEFSPVLFGDTTLSSPIYAFVKTFGTEYVYVSYVFFYSYNGSYNVLGLTDVGKHNSDIEHITIEFNKDMKPLRYFYAAHRFKDGVWHLPNEIEYDYDKHPRVYSAKYSHASYAEVGVAFRLLGTASDITELSYRWEPETIIVHEPDSPRFDIHESWFYYPGRWAPDGIRGVVKQDWYLEAPGPSSNVPFISYASWYAFVSLSIAAGLLIVIVSALYLSASLRDPLNIKNKKIISGSAILFVFTAYIFYAVYALLVSGIISFVSENFIVGSNLD